MLCKHSDVKKLKIQCGVELSPSTPYPSLGMPVVQVVGLTLKMLVFLDQEGRRSKQGTRSLIHVKGLATVSVINRITTFLEFLETWKCQGIRLRSVKSRKKGPKSGKSRGICVVGGNLIVAAQQNAGHQTVT